MNNGMSDAERRARHYEGLQIDAEVKAQIQKRRAKRYWRDADVWQGAAAREAGEAGLYGRKADELRHRAA